MTLPLYAINLDRSPERWQRLDEQARKFGLELSRVPAIDGNSLAQEHWTDFNSEQFERYNGRKALPGEYGCYRSHLLALQQFLDSGHGAAIILEDDVELNEQLAVRASAIRDAVPRAGLVKLISHRMRGFRKTAATSMQDEVGQCFHGPQGSAACYLVTRAGAQMLLETLRPMTLPYDVALERAWATGVKTYSSHPNLVKLVASRGTTIGRRIDYHAAKSPKWSRIPAHLFRTTDYLRRMFYVLGV
ncbi:MULTISPECIES: glycosyltransferase family 25 protein [unclassified Sinorhizobium]|uniref:glycosyltransferase family 25 protein n=1 Tax=unclassified Sinorhizobium TaxID=2613772 RepID=UPI003523B301